MSYVALVIGSTGAVGRDLVAELVQSAKCAKVIALSRREIPETKWATTFPAMDVTQAQSKLEIRQVDFDQLSSSTQVVIHPEEKIDAAFSCLGTTRKDAGSAEAFRKGTIRSHSCIAYGIAAIFLKTDSSAIILMMMAVDLEYTTQFGELAKGANVPYFGLLTSNVSFALPASARLFFTMCCVALNARFCCSSLCFVCRMRTRTVGSCTPRRRGKRKRTSRISSLSARRFSVLDSSTEAT